jgi:hypothetical protein
MYDLGGYNLARFEKVVADAQAIYDTYASNGNIICTRMANR